MSVSKSTSWGNSDINATFAHKEYILKKAVKQYWFGIKPTDFKRQWRETLQTSVNYKRSKRKDYRFVFSVKKNGNNINLQKFYAMCIQVQKRNFNSYSGIFAIHEKDTDIHVHFLLNPVNISNSNRTFHKISPQNYDNIKKSWEHYLNIFQLSDGYSYSKFKQRSWGQYYSDRKKGLRAPKQNFKQYNMQMKEKFTDEFFNPFIDFLNRNAGYNFQKLTRKKYKKLTRNSYYQTADLLNKIKEIKEKWKDIRWALLMSRLIDSQGIEFFENIFSLNSNSKPKLAMSFPELQKKCQSENLTQMFQEAKQLSNQFQHINDCINLELNQVKNDDFYSSISR